MNGKHHRLWEGCKTVLIILLSCSAIYLAGLTLFPQQPGAIPFRLPQSTAAPFGDATVSFSAQTLRPAALAVTWEDGRYGLLYHQEDQEAYTQFSALLAEALSNASAPAQSTRGAWLRALYAPGAFCEYLGTVPLDALTRWLSGQDNPALAGAQARQLCVAADALYFRTGNEGYFVCALEPDMGDALANLFPHFSSNGARFAGEDGHYKQLRADSLVLSTTPSLPQLTAENPVAVSDPVNPPEALSQFLQILAFHPQTNPLYAITGGWAITDGGETLRISADGQITYRSSEGTDPRFPAADILDATRLLAEQTVGTVCGSGRLCLLEVAQDGNKTVVSYGYAYRGAAIQVGGTSWCAQFTVENNVVTAFVLKPRRYAAAEGTAVLLLPQEQAAAAMPENSDQALIPLYDDTGSHEGLDPFWAVRSLGR